MAANTPRKVGCAQRNCRRVRLVSTSAPRRSALTSGALPAYGPSWRSLCTSRTRTSTPGRWSSFGAAARTSAGIRRLDHGGASPWRMSSSLRCPRRPSQRRLRGKGPIPWGAGRGSGRGGGPFHLMPRPRSRGRERRGREGEGERVMSATVTIVVLVLEPSIAVPTLVRHPSGPFWGGSFPKF